MNPLPTGKRPTVVSTVEGRDQAVAGRSRSSSPAVTATTAAARPWTPTAVAVEPPSFSTIDHSHFLYEGELVRRRSALTVFAEVSLSLLLPQEMAGVAPAGASRAAAAAVVDAPLADGVGVVSE